MPPRPSVVALAAFITISIILFLHQFSAGPSYYRDVFTRSHSLTAWLSEEEERYAAFIQDRQQLIRKWGPTEPAVEPCVPPAVLYTFLTTMPVLTGIPRTVSCTRYVRTRALMCANYIMLTHRSLTLPGDFFIPAFQCPHRVERIGTLGDGGKWTCGVDRVAKQEKCVIYSFGLSPCLSPLPLSVTSEFDRCQ